MAELQTVGDKLALMGAAFAAQKLQKLLAFTKAQGLSGTDLSTKRLLPFLHAACAKVTSGGGAGNKIHGQLAVHFKGA